MTYNLIFRYVITLIKAGIVSELETAAKLLETIDDAQAGFFSFDSREEH